MADQKGDVSKSSADHPAHAADILDNTLHPPKGRDFS
jgi:hypothetical protein